MMRIDSTPALKDKIGDAYLAAHFVLSMPERKELLVFHMINFQRLLDIRRTLVSEGDGRSEVDKESYLIGAIIFATTDIGLIELGKTARMYMNGDIGKRELRKSINIIMRHGDKELNPSILVNIYDCIVKASKKRKKGV